MKDTTLDELDGLVHSAAAAFPRAAASDDASRAGWLRAVADRLEERRGELAALAHRDTALPVVRLEGEVDRTTAQLRMFAMVIEEGSYAEAIIDHAEPGATPPRPDLRRILVPLGPVGVFSASNFPFAFSVAGGDTASALAVGCPVIVKAHPGHAATSRLTAEVVSAALVEAGAPAGIFSIVEGHDAGIALVEHPLIRAIAFTGSTTGGRALFDRAAARPNPIPFYGELGSVNPVVVTPGADAARGDELAAGLAASFQLGAGQFCTKPGLVFVPSGSRLEASLPAHVGTAPLTLLTPAIGEGFAAGVAAIASIDGVELVAGSAEGARSATPAVVVTDLATAAGAADEVFDEIFGPATVLIRYDDLEAVPSAIAELGGTLTATIHSEADESVDALVSAASAIAGRVLFSGWPTGVAVTWSQHHGGPWPSTTSTFTSVGATAVRRFQRPIVFQDAPEHLLPEALREGNPLHLPRRVDGRRSDD